MPQQTSTIKLDDVQFLDPTSEEMSRLAHSYGLSISSTKRSPQAQQQLIQQGKTKAAQSLHLSGTAMDVLGPSDKRQKFLDDMKTRYGTAITEALDEGSHSHIGWRGSNISTVKLEDITFVDSPPVTEKSTAVSIKSRMAWNPPPAKPVAQTKSTATEKLNKLFSYLKGPVESPAAIQERNEQRARQLAPLPTSSLTGKAVKPATVPTGIPRNQIDAALAGAKDAVAGLAQMGYGLLDIAFGSIGPDPYKKVEGAEKLWNMLGEPQLAEYRKVQELARERGLSGRAALSDPEIAQHFAAAFLPMVGPMASHVIDRARSGDVAGAVGEGAMLALPLVPKMLRKFKPTGLPEVPRVLAEESPSTAAAVGEAQAAGLITKVKVKKIGEGRGSFDDTTKELTVNIAPPRKVEVGDTVGVKGELGSFTVETQTVDGVILRAVDGTVKVAKLDQLTADLTGVVRHETAHAEVDALKKTDPAWQARATAWAEQTLEEPYLSQVKESIGRGEGFGDKGPAMRRLDARRFEENFVLDTTGGAGGGKRVQMPGAKAGYEIPPLVKGEKEIGMGKPRHGKGAGKGVAPARGEVPLVPSAERGVPALEAERARQAEVETGTPNAMTAPPGVPRPPTPEGLLERTQQTHQQLVEEQLLGKPTSPEVQASRNIRDVLPPLGKRPGFANLEGREGSLSPVPSARMSGIDPITAIREADQLSISPGDMRVPGAGSFEAGQPTAKGYIRSTGSPLSRAGQPGQYELKDPVLGKELSNTFNNAHYETDRLLQGWSREQAQIDHYLDEGFKETTGSGLGLQSRIGRILNKKSRDQFTKDFIELVERPFDDSLREEIKASNTSVGNALRLHDNLTENFRQYIIDSQRQLGRTIPDDWGITEKGYFRHLFLGDIKMIQDGKFIGTTNTYAEAQKMAFEVWKTNPDANIQAVGRNIFAGDPTLRLTSKKYHTLVGRIFKTLGKTMGDEVFIDKAELKADLRGIVGQERSKQKPLGALFKREGYEGFSTDYSDVMRMHTAQLARTQELSKLNAKVQPIREKLIAQGKSGLAEDVQMHLDHLWGKPAPVELRVGEAIRKTPVLRNVVANPDFALRGLARKLTRTWNILKLDYNIRSTTVNMFQPLSTLWPYVSSKEFAGLYADFVKPSTRRMLVERGVFEGAIKLEEAGISPTKAHITPFRAASEVNRGIGYLHGIKDAARQGITGEAAHRWGLQWAERVEFDNSVWNVAPIMRSPVAKVLGQYKGFLLKDIENIRHSFREVPGQSAAARRVQEAKQIGSRIATGGLNTVLKATPFIAGYSIVRILSDQLQQHNVPKEEADKLAEATLYGAPSLVGMDLSGSFSLVDFFGRTPQEMAANFALGPTIGTGLMAAQNVREPSKIPERLTPLARSATGIYKAIKGEPQEINLDKNFKITLTKYEAIMRALGFTILRQSRFYDQRNAGAKFSEPKVPTLPTLPTKPKKPKGERRELPLVPRFDQEPESDDQ